eukprot:3082256-Rhodomonas_salina.9
MLLPGACVAALTCVCLALGRAKAKQAATVLVDLGPQALSSLMKVRALAMSALRSAVFLLMCACLVS